jgi:hypothetical protein
LLAVLALVVGSAVAIGSVASSTEAPPTIASDKADYAPGSTVNLTGDGWSGDTTVHLSVNDTLGKSWQREVDVPVDADGRVSDSFVLPSTFVAQYDVLATGQQTGRTATTAFTDSSGDIDQCANGTFAAPENCNNTWPNNWVNGNLNSGNSHYFEGDSVPYRMVIDGLTPGSTGNTAVFAWDVTQGDKHALDYLTDFDRTVGGANPCTGIAGCVLANENNFPIPADSFAVAQIAGSFSMWGGTITSASAYGINPGANDCVAGDPNFADTQTDIRCITVTFTATASNPVLAWGGHIATRQDWGANSSSVAINGSPFHMHFIALNGSGGNQDKSLSNDAVIFPATIKIIKHVAPPSATSFGFTAGPSPLTNFSLVDNDANADPVQTFTLDALAEFTTYTVTENAAPGYTLSNISCLVTAANQGSATPNLVGRSVSIDIKEGETRTCTFTNDLQTGTLTVIKHVVNDDGGSAGAGAWSIHVKNGGSEVTGSPQNGSETGTQYTLNAGTYDLSETGGPSGYGFDGFSGDCSGTGSVTLGAGESKTCTLTNNDIPARLKLVKIVDADDGGGAGPGDFTLSATGTSGSFSSTTDTPIFHNVTPGVVYTLSETGPAGYSGGSWNCVGATVNGSTITVPLGTDVTCTISNTDNAPTLTLVKSVVKDDGGTAVADDWTLTATATAVGFTDRNFSNAGGSGTPQSVYAGKSYALSESAGPAGYATNGEWVCTGGGTLNGAKNAVTVGLDEDVTCTITNTDTAPTLTLVKSVANNDGGTAVADDWNLSATATAVGFVDRNFSHAGGSGTPRNVYAGKSYALSESGGPAGYSTNGEWVCSGGSLNAAKNAVTVALDEDVTCTITNTDNTPQLKLVKSVVNNDGGTTAADFWTLSATADAPNNGRNFSTFGGQGVLQNVFAGVAYTLAENPNPGAGYSSTGQWSCPGGVMSAGNTVVTVPLGAQVTCTIVNTDNAPQLRLQKTVTNNDGGTAVAGDWTLSAAASAPDDGRNFSDSGSSVAFHTVFAGVEYALSENPNPGSGYSSSGQWSCTGGTMNAGNTAVTVGLGAQVTCTIINTDDTPQLKLVKTVENNDGGTKTADDWTLSATASAVGFVDRNFSNLGGSGGLVNVYAGKAYTLAETPNPGTGYSSSGQWTCPGGVMSSGNTVVTVPLGAQVTCTITNTDNTPQLKLVKSVVNNDGGTTAADFWTLSATADAPNNGRNFSTFGGQGVLQNVFAGVAYTLAENPNPGAGYSSTGQWSCPGGVMSAGNTVVTVPLGAQVTCTVTNDDITPTLKLVKHVSGGSATAASFNLTATAPGNPLSRNFSSQTASPAFHNVAANAVYALGESGPAGYTASAWTCDGGTQNGSTVSVPLGGAVTCEITNTRDQGSIEVTKYDDRNGDGDSESGADPKLGGWTMFVDLDKSGTYDVGEPTGSTSASGSVTFSGLNTNVGGSTYWVCEVQQAGWVNSDPGGTSVSGLAPCKSTTVSKDATSQVVFGNFQRVKIQVDKTLDGGAVPNGITFQFSIRKDASTNPNGTNGGFGTVIATGSVTGPDGTITSAEWAVAGGQQYPLNPGTYQLCEAIVEGYTPHWTQGAYGTDWFSPGIQAANGFQESENSLVCITFTVASGDGGADNTVELDVNNVTKGFSHTIGFWKNWTSCDGTGSQFPMLDLMITGGSRNGITYAGADDSNGNGLRDIRIGNLYIEGPNACKIAVDLLDKRPVGDPARLGDKAKAASDPVYNSVSQLVAFELNQLLNASGTGSAACQAKATDAARLMQRFLTYIDFRRTASNSTYTLPSNKTRAKDVQTNLLYLANVIDDYNNNTIGSCAAALVLPAPTVAGTSPLQTWAAFLPAYTDT